MPLLLLALFPAFAETPTIDELQLKRCEDIVMIAGLDDSLATLAPANIGELGLLQTDPTSKERAYNAMYVSLGRAALEILTQRKMVEQRLTDTEIALLGTLGYYSVPPSVDICYDWLATQNPLAESTVGGPSRRQPRLPVVLYPLPEVGK